MVLCVFLHLGWVANHPTLKRLQRLASASDPAEERLVGVQHTIRQPAGRLLGQRCQQVFQRFPVFGLALRTLVGGSFRFAASGVQGTMRLLP